LESFPGVFKTISQRELHLTHVYLWGETVHLHAMKLYVGVEAQLHSFLTSAVDGGEWSAWRSGRFAAAKEPIAL